MSQTLLPRILIVTRNLPPPVGGMGRALVIWQFSELSFTPTYWRDS